MSLFVREKRQWQAEPVVSPWSIASTSGSFAGDMGPMQSSAVWQCRHLIASTCSMMPLESYTWKQGVRVPTGVTPSLLKRPSADANLGEWLYMLIGDLLTGGNSVGRIVQRDSGGYPTQIELGMAKLGHVQPGRPANYLDLDGQPISAGDVAHAKAYRVSGLPVGLSPLQFAAYAIGRDKAIQNYSLGYFNDAPHPQAMLSSDQPITEEQASTIKKRLMSLVGREPMVAGAGITYKPMAVSAEESQFLATQKYGAAEICRFFNMKPSKIAAAEVGSSMTYASVEADGIDFLTYCIQWWLTTVESFVSDMLPGGLHVRFNPSVLLRTDMETQMKATAIGIASKQMTPDEARAERDEPPLTQAQKDVLGLVPLDISPGGGPKALPTAAPEQAAVTDTPSDTSTDPEGTP